MANLRGKVGGAIVAGCMIGSLMCPVAGMSQTKEAAKHKGSAPGETVSAVFMSDIHFEPFFDPDKVSQLAAAPVGDWKTILAAPASTDREERFAALENTCKTRGEDSSYPLFASSLEAIHHEGAGAKFATVSGDLLSHAFSCKFGAIFPALHPAIIEPLSRRRWHSLRTS